MSTSLLSSRSDIQSLLGFTNSKHMVFKSCLTKQFIKRLIPPTFTNPAESMPPPEEPPTNCDKRDYIGAVEYDNNIAEAYYHEEGRINLLPGMNLRHEYSLRDHLGNTRICFTDSDNDGDPEILQQTNYYPFGLPIQELSTTFDGVGNNYQYNGKELNEDFGLHWMDYGARWYDPQINIWGQVDPLAEKHVHISPYAYAGNNPMIFVDPDGEFIVPYWIQEKYPEFYKYINNTIGNFFLNNQTVKDVLYKYSVGGLTESAIKKATTPDNGPKIGIKKFENENQLGEYNWKENTIFFNENLVSIFNSYISNESIDDKLKSAIAITLTRTLVNEFTHYGDALDGLDAILKEGKIVNGPPEGAMFSEYDEGNEAAKALYPFENIGSSKSDIINSGFQNYLLLKNGDLFHAGKGKVVESDKSKKNPSLIPPIKE